MGLRTDRIASAWRIAAVLGLSLDPILFLCSLTQPRSPRVLVAQALLLLALVLAGGVVVVRVTARVQAGETFGLLVSRCAWHRKHHPWWPRWLAYVTGAHLGAKGVMQWTDGLCRGCAAREYAEIRARRVS